MLRPCYTRQFFLQLVSQRWRLKNIASCKGGVTRSRYFFAICKFQFLWYLNKRTYIPCRHSEISREARKTRSDWVIFTKLRCGLRWTCYTQQLVSQGCVKLRIFLLFLQLATQHFVVATGCKKWGVTREIFLATCLATLIARQVARKISSCSELHSPLLLAPSALSITVRPVILKRLPRRLKQNSPSTYFTPKYKLYE